MACTWSASHLQDNVRGLTLCNSRTTLRCIGVFESSKVPKILMAFGVKEWKSLRLFFGLPLNLGLCYLLDGNVRLSGHVLEIQHLSLDLYL